MHTFVERDYPLLHAACKTITLYMDKHDQALGAAELINRTPSLGKHPFALVHPAPERTSRGAASAPMSMKALPQQMRGYASPDELAIRPSAARPALDVDVIDTSWMDTNTVGPRHNYFSVNRWLIDDLSEIVKTRKRAASRPHRLIKLDSARVTDGNVWVFLAAPSWFGT